MKFLQPALLLGILVAAAACAPSGMPAEPESHRLLVIGVDGLEWDVLLPLVREGRLPALSGLIESGHYGKLRTLVPARSPAVWTSIATGKPLTAHGIDHFVVREAGGVRLQTSLDRRTSALWNIFTDFDRRVLSVGWWVTYPVEPVRGVMVAQTNTLSQIDTSYGRAVWKGTLVEGEEGQVFPPGREREILGLAADVVGGFDERVETAYGPFPHAHSELGRRLWDNTLWSLRADMIYERIASTLLDAEEPFDLALVYFGAPDVVGHRFWRYAHPEDFIHPVEPSDLDNYGSIIEKTYIHADAQIARLLAAAGDDVSVIVLSDHGMHATGVERLFPADDPPLNVNSAEHQDGPPGVVIATGPAFRRAERRELPADASDIPEIASVYDVAPTILALAAIPIGDDMVGSVIEDWIPPDDLAARLARRIETHDLPGWRKSMVGEARDPEAINERLEQLRSLGYIN